MVATKSRIMIDGNAYYLISQGENGQVVEISNTECAKIFELGSSKKEVSLMRRANSINGLLCKFRRIEYTPEYSKELLIMERLYPLQYRALTVHQRKQFFDLFLIELSELHRAGFAHGDIKRPQGVISPWDNIVLTQSGIRLIDAGCAATPDDWEFEKWKERDIEEAMEFRDILLIP